MFRFAGVSLIAVMPFSAALADLSTASYIKAKEAYQNNNCVETVRLLRAYFVEDQDFLINNPSIKRGMDAVVEYCMRPSVSAVLSGAQIIGSNTTANKTKLP